MRFVWLLAAGLTLARPALSEPVRIELGAGANLISVPPIAATSSYKAGELFRDTSALAVVEPDGTAIFLGGPESPDFALSAGRSVLVLVASARSATLLVPQDSSPDLPRVTLQTARGFTRLSLPVLPGAASELRASDLARLTGANIVTRGAIAGQLAVFETFVAGAGSPGFVLEPGRGYLISVSGETRATQFELYTDANDDSIPDSLGASIAGGGSGDADSDGLSNLDELRAGTAPERSDTDLDGVPDGFEVLRGFDPFLAGSRPPAPRVDAVSPAEVSNDALTLVTIDGAGFLGLTSVGLLDPVQTALVSVQVQSDNRIAATVPSGVTPGTYALSIVNPAGTSQPGLARITVSNPAPRFAADIYPIFLSRCSGCHSPGGRGSGDWADSTSAGSYTELQNFGVVDTGNPAGSRLLRKPLAPSAGGIVMDGGTVIFQNTNDPDYQKILRWIEAGGKND